MSAATCPSRRLEVRQSLRLHVNYVVKQFHRILAVDRQFTKVIFVRDFITILNPHHARGKFGRQL